MNKQRVFIGFPALLLLVYFITGGLNPHAPAFSLLQSAQGATWEYPHYLSADALPLFYFNPEAGSPAVSLSNPFPPAFKDSFKELKTRIKTSNYLLVQHSTRYVQRARVRLLKFPATALIFPFNYFW